MKNAKPGDVFTIFPGTYTLRSIIKLDTSGTISRPITVRPTKQGGVVIKTTRSVGFRVSGANWIFEDLTIIGSCNGQEGCDHAFQLIGDADRTIIRRNRLIDLNAAIKANGVEVNGRRVFPDNVLIEQNDIYNNSVRDTRRSVTPIDVVGGRYWRVVDNFIADFAKGQGNRISYGAFLKGNGSNGLFDRNLIICEWKHTGGVRLGLSFGGGGTGKQYCEGGNCAIEHYAGTMRSNVILNCPQDVGVYLNKAANSRLINNTILGTKGVDVRFNTSFTTFANNVIEGRIKDRDGGRHRSNGDMIESDLNRTFPLKNRMDFEPASPGDLVNAASGFKGVDFCSGETQEKFKGAFDQPQRCSIRDRIRDVEARAREAERIPDRSQVRLP